jgi:hypothetical protein
MKIFLIIRTQFDASHNWPLCDIAEVDFLRYPHRHVFHVEAKMQVEGNDREREFIVEKRQLEEYLRKDYSGRHFEGMSCEMICLDILDCFPHFYSVAVFEDGENGSLIERS